MEKKILIALDDTIHARKAVEYALMMRSAVMELSYALFHVQPNVSEFLFDQAKTDANAKAKLDALIKKNQADSKKLLDGYKHDMMQCGVPEKSIETISCPRIQGAAKDILDYAKENLLDAILLGRRRVSRVEESFAGSVSGGILENTHETPVWAIHGQVKNTGLLVAVDGSQSALRALDHAAFMLESNPDARLTLLHVKPRLRDYCTIEFENEDPELEDIIVKGSMNCVADFYGHARKRLDESGITQDRVSIREVKSLLQVGKTIVEEAQTLGCGNIIIGRSGMDRSFFLGSVSRYVLTHAENCAVWLVP